MRGRLAFLLVLIPGACVAAQDTAVRWTRHQLVARLASSTPISVNEIPGLIDALKSPDRAIRRAAMRFWAVRGDEAREALWGDDDEDTDSRSGSVIQLCEKVVGLIEKAVSDPDRATSLEALRDLCALGTPVSVICPPVGRCGNGMEFTFEPYVTIALSKIEPSRQADMEAVSQDPDPTVGLNALSHVSKDRIQALQPRFRKLLINPDKYWRAVALDFIKSANDADLFRTVGPLLDDPDEDVRSSASWAFQDGLQDLRTAFQGRAKRSAGVRLAIATKIGNESGFAGRSHMLVELLDDPVGSVRQEALSWLCRGDSSSPELTLVRLRSLVVDPEGRVRATALQELCERDEANRKQLIRTGLADEDRDVRTTAGWCCGHWSLEVELTDAVVGAIEKGMDDDWMVCAVFSCPLNDNKLDGWVTSDNVNLRRAVALNMDCEKDAKRVLPRYLRLVNDSDFEVLRATVYGLADCGGAEAVSAIETIARRSQGDLLVEALRSLGHTKGFADVAFVTPYLESSQNEVRKAAKSLLKAISQNPPQ